MEVNGVHSISQLVWLPCLEQTVLDNYLSITSYSVREPLHSVRTRLVCCGFSCVVSVTYRDADMSCVSQIEYGLTSVGCSYRPSLDIHKCPALSGTQPQVTGMGGGRTNKDTKDSNRSGVRFTCTVLNSWHPLHSDRIQASIVSCCVNRTF